MHFSDEVCASFFSALKFKFTTNQMKPSEFKFLSFQEILAVLPMTTIK